MHPFISIININILSYILYVHSCKTFCLSNYIWRHLHIILNCIISYLRTISGLHLFAGSRILCEQFQKESFETSWHGHFDSSSEHPEILVYPIIHNHHIAAWGIIWKLIESHLAHLILYPGPKHIDFLDNLMLLCRLLYNVMTIDLPNKLQHRCLWPCMEYCCSVRPPLFMN